MKQIVPLLLLCLLVSAFHSPQSHTSATNILPRYNQLGYPPTSPKRIIVGDASSVQAFFIQSLDHSFTYFRGQLKEKGTWEHSGEHIFIADFSDFQRPGTYKFRLEKEGSPILIRIAPQPYTAVHKASLKAFYYQRASFAIDRQHGGKWARPAGHLDTQVRIHPTAASQWHPSGSYVSAPGGWYDAGDYGKYTVNASVSTAYLLALYERFPQVYDTLSIGNSSFTEGIGDLLSEIEYNLAWLLQMQEKESGMVYHKLSSLSHAGMRMPHEDKKERYMIGKSTAANLDFAAVMAMASRVYKNKLPVFSALCLSSAQKAWEWAVANPDVHFENPEGVHTGDYRDDHFEDEWIWAAVELYITTRNEKFLPHIHPNGRYSESPNWQELSYFSLIEMGFHVNVFPGKIDQMVITSRLQNFADDLLAAQEENPYGIPLGHMEYDFLIGSNSKIADRGMLLLETYRLRKDSKYLDAALACLDYLLGRNATGYCFVSGFGTLSPQHIHHRPSQMDTVEAPVPGFLVGGPNGISTDECTPKGFPAKAYVDAWCSYTTNEVTINWNAPFAFLSGAIEATLSY